MSDVPHTSPTEPAPWRGLAVLIALGLYTYMDRQIIGLQAEPIRQQLGLGDTQFGLIQGAGGALMTALVGYPLAWLADRCDRRWVLAGCLIVWCVAVALCGSATSFRALLLASALVGAAEAGLLPIAYAAIPEWFQGKRRQTANSMFVLLGRLAVGLVIAACGWLIHAVDHWRPHLPIFLQNLPTWRLVLWTTALPGALLLPLVLTLPAMHARTPLPAGDSPTGYRIRTVLREHAAVFSAIFASFGLLSLGANAFGTFVPVVAARAWGVTPLELGQGFGAAAVAGAVSALLITTLLTRATGLTGRPSTAMGLASVAIASASVTVLAAPLASSAAMFFVLYGLSLAGVMTAVMLLPTALQPLCPSPTRVRLMSIFVGSGIVAGSAGPVVVGALSDGLGGTADGLIVATATVAAASKTLAALLLAWGARRARRAEYRSM